MNRKEWKEKGVYTVFFTFIYSFVFILILSIAYGAFRAKIDQNKTLFVKEAVLNALGIPYQSEQDLQQIFNERIKPLEKDGRQVFLAVKNGEQEYAFTFSGNGLWGTITGILATDGMITRIIGMDIISHNETPGLGGRIEETWFKEQFRNESLPEGKIQIIHNSGKGNYNHEDGEVDSITGASLTSSLFGTLINSTISNARIMMEELSNE